MYTGRVDMYREAIWRRLISAPMLDEIRWNGNIVQEIYRLVWLRLDQFRIFGFIDCTDVQMCRPTPDESSPFSAEELQRSFYSNYFKAHGVKFQVVVFPDGMIGSIFGCSIRHNDNGVLNMSGLCTYLMNILTPMISSVTSVIYPALYGDAIYQVTPTIIRRHTNPDHFEQLIDIRMSCCRMFIEHRFGTIFKLFKLLGTKHRHRVGHGAGDNLMHTVFTSFILLNCYTCLKGSGSYFDIQPPSIEEYLPLDEDFPPAPDVIIPDAFIYG